MTTDNETIMELTNVTKQFGGLKAVNNLSFSLPKGKVTALIGPNGAGKTTVINLITGIYKVTSGDIKFLGESVTKFPPHVIAKKGISRTFQITKMFLGMTVIENVLLGREFGRLDRFAKLTLAEERDYAMEMLRQVKLEDYANKYTRELSLGQQRWLELARALATEPKLLLLDEPSSGLNVAEGEALLEKLRGTCAGGCTILLIEHNMRVMQAISDYVVVINFGEKLLTGTPNEIKNDKKVIEVYLGEELANA